MARPIGTYKAILRDIFGRHFKHGRTEFDFERREIFATAEKLGRKLPDNKGDVIYNARVRSKPDPEIAKFAPPGMEWRIRIVGGGLYRYILKPVKNLAPRDGMRAIKIPNSVPEVVAAYARSGEQALLAKVRYSRLIDIFLGVTAYSLQGHLKSKIPGKGNIEIDELYAAVDKRGRHYIVPVEAKGGKDHLSEEQLIQGIVYCREKYPDLICRPVAVQFMDDERIAIFEFSYDDDELEILDERHYRLVPKEDITSADLRAYVKAR